MPGHIPACSDVRAEPPWRALAGLTAAFVTDAMVVSPPGGGANVSSIDSGYEYGAGHYGFGHDDHHYATDRRALIVQSVTTKVQSRWPKL